MKRLRLGSNNERFIESLGTIGKSPFEARTVSHHCATWNTCDFMFHMSNSSYSTALDKARCVWHMKMIATPMRSDQECVRALVASTHFAYLNEIPMLADFEVEVRLVSWDHKWVYLLSTFTTSPPKGSKTRIVNCLSITRTVNKIGRRTVHPCKLFALCGFGGGDRSNWDYVSKIRLERPLPKSSCTHHSKKGGMTRSQEWLVGGEDMDIMDQYEDQRKRNLDIIRAALDGDSIVGVERLREL